MNSWLKIASLCMLSQGIWPSSALAVQLSISSGGVSIDTGSPGGKFVLQNPILQKNDNGKLPGITDVSSDGKSSKTKFNNGMVVTVTLESDGKTIDYSCDQIGNCRGLAINMTLPIELANGGKYTFGSEATQTFPSVVGKEDFIAQGDYDSFRLDIPSGGGFILQLPKNWNKLQDNRYYNNTQSFEEQYLYLFDHFPGVTTFRITVSDLPDQGSKPAAGAGGA